MGKFPIWLLAIIYLIVAAIVLFASWEWLSGKESKMRETYLHYLGQAASIEQFEMFFKKEIRVGEERLMLAVLENAIESYQKYIRTGNRRFQEAEKWLFEQDREAPFSFENICETLQLHPEYVREGLLRWKRVTLETHANLGHGPEHWKLARSPLRHPSVRLRRIA